MSNNAEQFGTNLMTGHEYGSLGDTNAIIVQKLSKLAGVRPESQPAQPSRPSQNSGRLPVQSATRIIDDKMRDRASFSDNLNQRQGEQP